MKRTILGKIALIPAWILCLVAAILAAVAISKLRDTIEVPYIYIAWSSFNVLTSFLICTVHPNRVWLVPFLCNILVILPAAFDDTFWNTSFGLIIGSGIVLSVITGHLGAMLNRNPDLS